MSKYLYAAAVQGIQDFIFATDALKEIAGASEIVAQICDEKFKEILGSNFKVENLLIGAAGNIKYLFDEYSTCNDLVKIFPFEVAKMAPGITISQTVLEIKGEISSIHIDEAEKNLKTQRNLAMRPGTMSWMIAKRVPKTGLPVVGKGKDNDLFDVSTNEKLKVADKVTRSLFEKLILKEDLEKVKSVRFADDLKNIAIDNHSWIAVIHADGNDLGKKIPNLFQDISGEAFVKKQREFSKKLDDCTQKAAQKALYKAIFDDKDLKDLEKFFKKIIPVRPVICGGDDLTIIVPASHALDFTRIFLQEFENETKEAFKGWKGLENGLTACAGIAYITQKYPFHYGVEMAEHLCKHAKTIAKKQGKELTPSCLSFHKIESSFVRSYEEILKNELKSNALKNKPLSNCPYYLDEKDEQSVDNLKKWILSAEKEKSVATRLRQILSMLHTENEETIKMELSRIESLYKGKLNNFGVDRNNLETLSKLHDILSLNSFQK